MGNGESQPRALRYAELTGVELQLVRDTTGKSLRAMLLDDNYTEEVAYVLVWLYERRHDEGVTYKDVLERPMGDLIGVMQEALRDDPTIAGSGSS